jgi:hypothetical protein
MFTLYTLMLHYLTQFLNMYTVLDMILLQIPSLLLPHKLTVTMIWKEHSKSPGRTTRADGKPNLDFTKMNIMAAKRCAMACLLAPQLSLLAPLVQSALGMRMSGM